MLHLLADVVSDQVETAQPPEFTALFVKTLLLVGVLLAITFFALWVLKRIAGGRFEVARRESLVNIIERKGLTPKVSLWVVEIEEQKYLIVEAHSGVSCTPIAEKKA